MAATVDVSFFLFKISKKLKETEPFNVIFENSLPKGLFGANKKILKFPFCRPIVEKFRI